MCALFRKEVEESVETFRWKLRHHKHTMPTRLTKTRKHRGHVSGMYEIKTQEDQQEDGL